MKPIYKKRDTIRARELRNQATPAERELWKYLSRRQLDGLKFSRQMPVGPYFADFLCRELKLIIELDGYSHEQTNEQDHQRDGILKQEGYRVLRFTNSEVFENISGVLMRISQFALEDGPTPSPSRIREGDSV